MAKNKNSVQRLIGLDHFTKYGVKTYRCELVFFNVEPTNISVLSRANVEVAIHHLTMLLSIVPDIELIALDSSECFDNNKLYIKKRLLLENNEAIRKLLRNDLDHLDEIQSEMSSARQFMFCLRSRHEKEEQLFGIINRVEKIIADHGFISNRMTKSELKKMLALYFSSASSGDSIEDIEGEKYVLIKLYARFGIDDTTDLDSLSPDCYPTVEDLYDLTEREFMIFDSDKKYLYTEEILQNICLGIHSMCKGAEAKYFNGHTNIQNGEFVCFGVKV